MSPRFPFDAEDPFGSRPDEKPPPGWDDRFWEDVRERIQDQMRDEERPRLPGPPRRRGATARAIALVTLALLGAVAALVRGSQPERPLGADDPAATVVRVDGSREPAVAVEWARSGGCRSGYVVFQSLDPEISFVVIDRRLANP